MKFLKIVAIPFAVALFINNSKAVNIHSKAHNKSNIASKVKAVIARHNQNEDEETHVVSKTEDVEEEEDEYVTFQAGEEYDADLYECIE